MSRLPLVLACLLAATGVDATEVYRCAGADRVSYQDKPCAKDATQSVLHLDDAAPPPAPVATPATDATPADAMQPAEPPPAPEPARTPPPDFFLCSATDGSRYLSEDGIGRRSAVPYAMLAGSGKSLAQAYGGPNGIGVSAPELQKPPTVPARQDPLGASYVWVIDECHHADPQEACAYLRDEADKLDGKLRRAFSDTEKQLKQERAMVRERMQGC